MNKIGFMTASHVNKENGFTCVYIVAVEVIFKHPGPGNIRTVKVIDDSPLAGFKFETSQRLYKKRTPGLIRAYKGIAIGMPSETLVC